MAFGITDTGFKLKRLADILADMKAALSTVQDPVTGEFLTPDLIDENDPLIQLVNAVSDELSVGWEQLQLAYNQFDPQKATGAGLSGTVQLNSIQRKAGTKATGSFALTGTSGKILQAGKRASTMDDSITFEFPQITFDGIGEAVAIGTATESGPVEVSAGDVVKILTPVTGWDSVVNLADIAGGTLAETDTAFRERQKFSTTISSSSVIDSLYGALINIVGVIHARVYQNTTLTTDGRGIPGKEVSAVVLGGDDQEIADAIFSKLALGVKTYGNTLITKVDVQGFSYPVWFWRPIEVDVFVEVTIEVINSSSWPTDGIDLIKANILSYANSGARVLGITEGYDRNGYVPGESINASELYTPVKKQPAIKIISLFVSTVDPATGSSVVIDWDELAMFTSANINVTLV
jgi:uncharacterized phage protein gp47/JayE